MMGEYEPDESITLDVNFTSLTVGDDIVFLNARGQKCLKRIVGVPGSLLCMVMDVLIVDGEQIRLDNQAQTRCWEDWSRPGEVPENCVVVIGTGPQSVDSKRFGFLLIDKIVGKVIKDK